MMSLSTQPAAAGSAAGAGAAVGVPGAAAGVLAAGAAWPWGVQAGAVEGVMPLMAAEVPEMICLSDRMGLPGQWATGRSKQAGKWAGSWSDRAEGNLQPYAGLPLDDSLR